MSTATVKIAIDWIKHPTADVYTTRTVDPRNGKTYLGQWLPKSFALKMGMPPMTNIVWGD